MKYELGDQVMYNKVLFRTEKRVADSWKPFWKKEWTPTEVFPRTGILVGIRTLSNGQRTIYEDHTEYDPTEYVKVAVIAWRLSRKLDYVLLEDIKEQKP
jgi:hypothetical protein